MTNKVIKEAQKACLELIKVLELSKKEPDTDKIYESLKINLQKVNETTDKVFNEIIFQEEETLLLKEK